MQLDLAFDRDLRRWLDEVYDRTELHARYEDRRAAERVVERQNRIYIALIVIVAASIALIPLTGPTGILAALIVLYVGALVSSSFTAFKIRQLEHTQTRYEAIRQRGELAWSTRPQLGPDERALLIRIMNLSRLGSSGGRQALVTELAEARGHAPLADWPALRDAEILARDAPPPADDD